jgi:hypothetical protein
MFPEMVSLDGGPHWRPRTASNLLCRFLGEPYHLGEWPKKMSSLEEVFSKPGPELMPRTTLLHYVNEPKRLGDHVIVTLPNGDTLEGIVLSFMNIPGLETLTVGYGGMASELRQRDAVFLLEWPCHQCGGKRSTTQQNGYVVCDYCGEKQQEKPWNKRA